MKYVKLDFPPPANYVDAFHAAEVFFHSLRSGHVFAVSWALACNAADQTNEQSAEGLSRDAIISCSGVACKETTHLCPECWKVRLCGDFIESADFEYKICKHCKFVHQTQVGETQPENRSLIYRKLLRGLETRLSQEYQSAKIEVSESTPDVYEEAWNIMQTLKPLMISEHQCHDNMIEQDLDLSIVGKFSWSGNRRYPNTPSLDGYLPFVAGVDGRTRCHQAGNVHTIADWLNRMMTHYPKYLVIPLAEMQNQSDRTVYLSALAKMRDALKDSYEMGPFGHDKLSHRSNQELPENFDDFQDSVRIGKAA